MKTVKRKIKSKVKAKIPAKVQKFWRSWAQQELGLVPAQAPLVALPFDASRRRYYRVKGQKLIVADDPFLSKDQRQLRVYRVFRSFKIAVPRMYHVALKQGISVQQDVGDQSLLTVVATAKDLWPWLKKAMNILIRLHQSDFAHCLEARELPERFDRAKLMMEIDFTLKYFARDLLQASAAEIKALRKSWEKLCSALVQGPWVLVHRDFHTRNIMVVQKKLVVIDYQDAREGLPQYDLASLLYDAYWSWGEKNVHKALHYYWQHAPIVRGRFKHCKKNFVKLFYLQAAQRLFKALGTFAYQAVVRRNDRYLKYVGHTMDNLRQVLATIPSYQTLQRQVGNLYYPRS
ncbi:MAG: phosphotransferase [Bacteriovoracaceae bacterium]|nr:phosphotransferase [Bacteriovoracaceae bacterium]